MGDRHLKFHESRDNLVLLVNAAHLKHVPGRKTDVIDAQWIAEVLSYGLLRPSFVPPQPIRELRDLTRYRKALIRARTAEVNRLHKVLEDAGVKLATVATDVMGVSGREMMHALIAGVADPDTLAELAKARLRSKLPQLRKALTARFREHYAFLLARMLAHVEALEADIEVLSQRIAELMQPWAGQLAILDSITGVGARAAEVILAESGRHGALLRRAPLRTVHATRRRTRLKQAARALRVLLPRRLEDPPPQPPDVALMDPPVDGVPIRHVLRSVHRHGVQLALRLGRLDQHQRSKAHLPTSAPFRTQPPGLVSGQLSRAVDGGVDHVATGFLPSFDHRHSLVGHPAPAAEFRSPHGRPTRQPAPGPDGISTFRTSESRPDWVPSLPRGPAVLTRPVRSLRPPLAPTSRGQALSPRSSSHLRSYPLRGVIKGLLAFTRPAFPLAW